MGLITKEVEITFPNQMIKYYEDKGYKIPRINIENKLIIKKGTKIKININDLPENSNVKVDVQCDGCDKLLTGIIWVNYKTHLKKDKNYYCKECALSNFIHNDLLNNRISFEQWCIENNRQDVLNKWDFNLNKYKPSDVCRSSSKKYWFKCLRGIHESELKNISDFTIGRKDNINCNLCNSFAQWGIDHLGKDFLEKYWDYEKNTIDPWKISKSSNKYYVWIKCQEKNYHESYLVRCSNFSKNDRRCPYCSGQKIHPFDSLGTLFLQVLETWSDKNQKSPYEYPPMTSQKVYWKCPDGKHKDYKRNICDANKYNFRCPECTRERNESFLQEKTRLYLESLNYNILHENNCTIIPINPKTKMNLPFDNEIKELKLIIEVHGLQHYKIDGFHISSAKRNNTTPEYELHYQQVRDRYKRIFAKMQRYFYLEIPYWTNDVEETYKKLIDNKINKIKKEVII